MKAGCLVTQRLAMLEDGIEHHAEHGDEDGDADDDHPDVQLVHVSRDRGHRLLEVQLANSRTADHVIDRQH